MDSWIGIVRSKWPWAGREDPNDVPWHSAAPLVTLRQVLRSSTLL